MMMMIRFHCYILGRRFDEQQKKVTINLMKRDEKENGEKKE